MKWPRRTCRVCGKRRLCGYYVQHGNTTRISNLPLGFATSSDPRWWPKFLGWLCAEDGLALTGYSVGQMSHQRKGNAA